jgi:hypothetical protein
MPSGSCCCKNWHTGSRLSKCYIVKAQTHRTQLSNKAEVLRKMQELVAKALTPKKARIASKPSKAAKEKRIASKKQRSDIKKSRGKVNITD